MKIFIVIIISVVVTAGVLVGLGFAFRRVALGGSAEPTAVRVEPATEGALVEVVSVPGEIQPETRVKISARVPAQILVLPHAEGEDVTAFSQSPTAGAATQPAESSVLVRLDARDLESALKSVEARTAAQEAEIGVSQARLEAQQATIAAAEATFADAQRELSRQEQLYATRDVAEQAVDQARTRVTELSNQLSAARHNLDAEQQSLIVMGHQLEASRAEITRAREQLAYTVITSPIAGKVIRVNAKVGESVVPGIQGSSGSVILEVADLSRMLMIGRVDEAAVARVSPGQRAVVRMQAYRDRVFQGTVQSVALAKADLSAGRLGGGGSDSSGANYFEARILLDTEGEQILTGLNADADIEIKRHEGVKVPSQAVLGRPVDSLPLALRNLPQVEHGKQFTSVVYRMIDGKSVVTAIEVGPSDETNTLVLSGLKAGDPVITGPYKILDALQNDQEVKLEGAAPSAPAETQPAGGATREARDLLAPSTRTSGTSRPATSPAIPPTSRPATSPISSLTIPPAAPPA